MLPEVASLLLTAGILAAILWNQLRARRARTRLILPLILTALGAANLSRFLHSHPPSPWAGGVLAASLALDAVGLGAVRAYTVRLWSDGGETWRQGTLLTAALWIGGTAVHFLLDAASGLGASSALLYLGLTLASQRLVLRSRAETAPRS